MTPKRVLVVEDDGDQRLAISTRLRAEKFAVVLASDGVTAVSAAQKERPDLVVLDLGIPGGDGFTVIERLRAIPRLATIPIIVLTARDPVTTRERSIELGADAFFQKPVDSREFLAAVRSAVGSEP